MTDQDQTANTQPTPSQAEGDDDLGHQSPDKTTPSQAEGDEATIDEDIAQKEGQS